ncbi:transcription termination factor MTEF1, chloroplastic [Cynara cardunculus var. scolymus]|uniref:Mitochodrial transcription termination factor-related protein n=1 Tax=Cynara cardunculus var. scolymus TaxID=59895 RepID=A0A103XER8_CYNCS|nr:transcription termination factor MTEF1, chloroplastic [Cynara cardunculus var. scolymus]KVH89413.1 Mitochodrial transcription termination factor-related protein [Cynara cardunculus var. scolymus]
MAAAAAAAAFHSYSPQEQQQSTDTPQLSKKPKTLLHKHPLYTPTHTKLSLQFKEKILCLEVMGVDSGKALAQNPSLHSATLNSIHDIITFLQSKGIQQKDLPRIIGMCPKILTATITTDLLPVFNFLSHNLKIPDHNYRKVINKCPRLLVSSAKDQLEPALSYLQRLGFRDLQALAYQDCVLLVSNVENTLIPKLDYLIGLGFSRGEAVEMVLRCPGLFTFSLENNYRPKFEYFEREMRRDLGELKDFPQYFAFSLEKRIKPRHLEAVECGVHIPLPLLLKTTDDEFAELLKKGNRSKKL